MTKDYMSLKKKLNSVDNSSERCIIKTGEMFRKKTYSARQNNKPVSNDTFDRITIGAKKKGANIVRCEYGDETFLHLEKNKANACCIGDTLIFRPDATISEVLEETYHFEQNLVEMNIDKEPILKTILNEIDAKNTY